jgi:hypothetical protein
MTQWRLPVLLVARQAPELILLSSHFSSHSFCRSLLGRHHGLLFLAACPAGAAALQVPRLSGGTSVRHPSVPASYWQLGVAGVCSLGHLVRAVSQNCPCHVTCDMQ